MQMRNHKSLVRAVNYSEGRRGGFRTVAAFNLRTSKSRGELTDVKHGTDAEIGFIRN